MDTNTETKKRCEFCERAEAWVQEKPADAMIAAAGIGFLFAFLPMGKLLRAIFSFALTLLKPTLLVLGVLKLVEEVQIACVSCEDCECCDEDEGNEEKSAA